MTGGSAGEIKLEREAVEHVAQELVSDGYEVRVEPGPSFLPGKLARFRPDILAQRGDENLVVEVKLFPDAAAGGEVRDLAEAVKERPGWRFRLVTVPRDLAASPWTVEEATARVDEAEALARERRSEAALMLLVAAAEAVARRLGEIEGLSVQRWNSRTVPGELAYHGLVDQADANLLDRAQRLRNLLMHGANGGPDTAVDLPELVAVLHRLLAEVKTSRAELATAAPPSAAE